MSILPIPWLFGSVEQKDVRFKVWSEMVFVEFLFRVAEVGRWQLSGSDARELTKRGGRTVLVVEDNGGLRVLVTKALEARGYRVVSCDAPERALRLFEEEPVDLLLTDVVMPGVGGVGLARRLRARKQSLKVLLMSGHDQRELEDTELLGDGVKFLSKPFGIADLVRTVDESLGEHG